LLHLLTAAHDVVDAARSQQRIAGKVIVARIRQGAVHSLTNGAEMEGDVMNRIGLFALCFFITLGMLKSPAEAQTAWRVSVMASLCLRTNPSPQPECVSRAYVYDPTNGSAVYLCGGSWFSNPVRASISCTKFATPASGPVEMSFAGPFVVDQGDPYTNFANTAYDGDQTGFWIIGTSIDSLRYCRAISPISCSGAPIISP
jgi:hypothetical protein